MQETALTSHSLIAPYVMVAFAGLSIHAAAAVRMLSSVSGVTASAHGVRSRTCAARMAQNEMSRVGVRDLDLRAVVEPVLAEVVAIWLGSVTAGTSPRAAPISAHRVIDATELAGAARPTRDRPNRTNPARSPDDQARRDAHACTGAEPGETNLRGGKARR